MMFGIHNSVHKAYL